MAETVNVSSGLWPDSRRSNWGLTRRRLPNLAMVVGRAKDGSEKALTTPLLAKSSESSTGTITPCPAAHHLQYLAVEQDDFAARERLALRSMCMASLLSISMRKRLPVLDCTLRR